MQFPLFPNPYSLSQNIQIRADVTFVEPSEMTDRIARIKELNLGQMKMRYDENGGCTTKETTKSLYVYTRPKWSRIVRDSWSRPSVTRQR